MPSSQFPVPGSSNIGRLDEYLVHQTEKPLAEVASDHPEWQDRLYFNILDREGGFAAMAGMGAYPNRKMMQGYLLVIEGDKHYAYLNTRPLAADRDDIGAGTLRFAVKEPLVSWQLELADKANDIAASLEFRARRPLYEFSPIEWHSGEKLVVKQRHYTQAGRYEGSVRVGGRTYTGLVGIRDRSWGVRDMANVPVWIWIAAQFPDFCVSAWRWETPGGETIHEDGAITYESGEVTPITAIGHDLTLHAGSKRPKSAVFQLTAGGEKLTLVAGEIGSMFLLPPATAFDESDAEVLSRYDALSFGFDQYCRVTLGDQAGIGVVEYMFTGGSARYSIPAFRPNPR